MKALLAWMLISLGGCATARQTGILVLIATPVDARVLLDDRYIGSAGELAKRPMRLNVGPRRIEISAEGHYNARRDVGVTANARIELKVDLHEVPDGERGY